MDILVSRSDLDLNPAPIPPEWIVDGQPVARNRVLSKSRDGTALTLIWDCTAGQFNWIYDTDETIYIIEGSATLTDASGVRRIGAGDVVFFPAGTQAHWRVGEYVRKVAVFRHTLPRPLGLAVRVGHKLNQAITGMARAALARFAALTSEAGRRHSARQSLDDITTDQYAA